jgi:hypothetical protein
VEEESKVERRWDSSTSGGIFVECNPRYGGFYPAGTDARLGDLSEAVRVGVRKVEGAEWVIANRYTLHVAIEYVQLVKSSYSEYKEKAYKCGARLALNRRRRP